MYLFDSKTPQTSSFFFNVYTLYFGHLFLPHTIYTIYKILLFFHFLTFKNNFFKTGGTGATAKNKTMDNGEDLPSLLWSLSGQGLRTAHSEDFRTTGSNSSDSSSSYSPSVTYGTHAVVR